MIHSFKVENFYSINEEQEINFVSKKAYSDSYINIEGGYVSLVNCLVGANASGKTNLFKALSFFIWFTENSFYRISSDDIGTLFNPHKLREGDKTKFEIVFDINNKLYKYSLSLTPKEIHNEVLEIKLQKGYTYLYKLENQDGKISIKYNRNSNILDKVNKKEEKRFKTKKMATFFSFLNGIGYFESIGLIGINSDCFRNVFIDGIINFNSSVESVILSKKLENSKQKKEILSYLMSFDLGIIDYVEGIFNGIRNNKVFDYIGFKHSNHNTSFDLPIFEESSGTIKGTYLLLHLLKILSTGGVAIIDELDSGIHFDIARRLISLFANKDTNKNNAQLFFSTHQPLFLNDRDKTQIFLCYKEDYINTEIYRLDDIEGVRNTENFFEKYLSGEYGATPRLGFMNNG